MNNPYYPIYCLGPALKCLIIGGGAVAGRKVETLCRTGAQMTVVSPEVTPKISRMVKKGRITWVRDRYRKKYLKRAGLVIGATDDPDVNRQVYVDCRKAGILVNVVDDPAHCTFIVPSVFAKGHLCVAVSTGGAAPSFAARIRRELESSVPDEYAVIITELKKLRSRIKTLPPDMKEQFWKEITGMRTESFCGKPAQLRKHVRSMVKVRSNWNGRTAERRTISMKAVS